MKISLLSISAAAIALIAAQTFPVHAMLPGKAHNVNANVCVAEIAFPQGKDELSLSDVRRAVKNHLIKLDAPTQKFTVDWDTEDTISVRIVTPTGKVSRFFAVDAVTTQIVENISYRGAVGFSDQDNTRLAMATDESDYQKKLRRHMLGDGQSWGTFIGNARYGCQDDYSPSVPEIN